MSLAAYRDAVTAWNAVQSDDAAILSPDDERQLSAWLDQVPSEGNA